MKRYFNEKVDIWGIVAKLIIIVLLVLLVFDYVVYKKVREADMESFENIGRYVTSHTAKNVSDWIREVANTGEYIAETDVIIDACENPGDSIKREKAEAFIESVSDNYGYNENLGLVLNNKDDILLNIKGEEVLLKSNTVFVDSLGGVTLGQRYEGMPYIDEIFSEKEYFVSEAYPSVRRQNPIIVIGVPVKSGEEIIGAVFLTPKMNVVIDRFLKTSLEGNTGYLLLADDRGYIIAHKNTDFILSDGFKDREDITDTFGKIVAGETIISGSLYGINKKYYSKEILFSEGETQRRMYAVFTMDDSAIFDSSKDILLLISFVFFMGLIIIVFTVYNISRKRYDKKREKELEEKVEIRTKQLKELAEKDSLTGCLNHKSLFEILEKTIEKSAKNSFAIAMMDIDNFKSINDKYGHPKGDEVINKVAKVINKSLREGDIVGRYGGEEFLVIMPDINIEQAKMISERIRKNIEELIFMPEGFHVTISIGVTTNNNEESVKLVNLADELMYEAKKKGKNMVVSEIND